VTVAQIIASLRMRYFFHASGFHLNKKFACVLYYVGAFYNFLLPGGVGGDAYKVVLARKRMEMPAMQGIRIMIADRASGLCILMSILFASLYLIDLSKVTAYANLLITLAFIITLAAYVTISKLFLKLPPKVMLMSLPYSLVSQACWVLTLSVLWKSLGNGQNLVEYTMLYCVASIASMLPVSVGGLGIREMTYFYGASLITRYAGIAVDGNLGVVLSLCIFALTFISALPGVLWLNKVAHLHVGHPAPHGE
jgi:glycosyltransferase 2 family protein